MQADKILKPEIMVFAGPNGSGKSTIESVMQGKRRGIFKKRKDKYFHWENKYWDYDRITQLTGILDYS